MKIPEVLLFAGVIGILIGPVISLMPVFTPPPNGCPCPNGLDVRTPFVDLGIIIAIVGLLLISGGVVFRPGTRGELLAKTGKQKGRTTTIAAISGPILLLAAGILTSIDISGPGYQIYLYGAQGFYLGVVGVGALLFAGFSIATPKISIALSLAAGVVLCGLWIVHHRHF